MRRLLVKDLLWELKSLGCTVTQRSPECIDWISPNLTDFANEFVQKNKLSESHFIKNMNKTFKTSRFELLLKRWIVEYLEKFFRALNDFNKLILEDNPINRFGVGKYYLRFGVLPEIKWRKQTNLLQRIVSILLRSLITIYLSLNKGLRISGKRKKYKIMRETIWGLYDTGGYYFHDDFLVDGHKVKKEDLLLFFRGVAHDEDRLKAYHDAQKSSYGYFNLQSLPVGIGPLFSRIIPKYIISGSRILLKEVKSDYFSLYWSIYLYFKYNALPYEKVFSHFEIVSELGHNYFSANHIPEAIICQNHGTKYYLMHWSDFSLPLMNFFVSFLGCDRFLKWGNIHGQEVEADSRISVPTGYVFKRFIKEVTLNRNKVLLDLGIDCKGKVISFFDESFGGECKMTEKHFVNFWESALKLAEKEKNEVILIRPKELGRYNSLSKDLKEKFIDIKNKIKKKQNIHIVNSYKWSFVEVVGVSDIVVTQGMTSSATIAIICGIVGLYLDQAHYSHPFSMLFKDRIVFDDSDKLIFMIQRILKGIDNPLKDIPEQLLRAYDAYPDDRGIDLFRDILSGSKVEL